MLKIVKVVIEIVVGVIVGIMVNDFTKKYVATPLQKFADSVAEKSRN
jgi:small basic protein